MRYRKDAFLAKFDPKRTYHSFPVCESVHYLLGMTWRNKFYVDLALPFGLSKTQNIFSRGVDILLWILGEPDPVDEDDLQHYDDDFLIC